MLNKSLFTAFVRSTGNAGCCGSMPSADFKLFYNRDTSALTAWLNFNNAAFDYNAIQVTATVYDVVPALAQASACSRVEKT